MFTIFFALMASAGAQSREEVWAYPIFLGLGLGVVTSTRESTTETANPGKRVFLVMLADPRSCHDCTTVHTPGAHRQRNRHHHWHSSFGRKCRYSNL